MTRVAVVGAGGFIGRSLVTHLVQDGAKVLALGRRSSPTTLGWPALVETGAVDFQDDHAARRALVAFRPTVVINLATVRRGDAHLLHAINVVGPSRLVEACARAGVRRLIHATSATEYGGAPAPLREDGPTAPNTPYGRSRLAGSIAALAAGHLHQVEVLVLRLFQPFGPSMSPDLLLPRALVCARTGETLPLTPPGATRDFVHIQDVCRAFAAAVDAAQTLGGIANVCSGAPTDNHALVDVVEQAVGRPVQRDIGAVPLRPWDRPDWYGDTARAAEWLGWGPRVSLLEGVSRLDMIGEHR